MPLPYFFQAIQEEKSKILQIVEFQLFTAYPITEKKNTSVSCTSATTLQVKEKIQDMQQDFQHLSCNDVFETQHHSYKQPYRGINRWFDIILQTLDCQVLIGL